jgi:hypothetical protein
MSELPVDFTYWLEQGMDPTHANYLHHTCEVVESSAAGPRGLSGCKQPAIRTRTHTQAPSTTLALCAAHLSHVLLLFPQVGSP